MNYIYKVFPPLLQMGLAERTAELYQAGVSELIIISGYKPPSLNITEAELLANKCYELGVSKEAVLLGKDVGNTGENILFSARLVQKYLERVDSIVLVHKPYVSLRFLATAEAQ